MGWSRSGHSLRKQECHPGLPALAGSRNGLPSAPVMYRSFFMRARTLIVTALVVDGSMLALLVMAVFVPFSGMLILATIPLFVIGVILGAMSIGRKDMGLPLKLVLLSGPFLLPLSAVGLIQLLKIWGILG